MTKLRSVTGGSRGIGAAIAIKLAEHGAHLAINYVSSATAAEAVAEQVRSHGVTAITVKADVSQEEEVSAMFKTIMEEFGRLDIAVSNSGIEYFAEHAETTGADIDRVFGVNVKGQYFVAQEAYRYMEDFGRVMLTSSISAVKVRIGRTSIRSISYSDSLLSGRPGTRGLCLVQGGYSRHGEVSSSGLWSSQYHCQCHCGRRSEN